jgi:hypothetical protein
MARVHKARREILPPADEFLDAPIDPAVGGLGEQVGVEPGQPFGVAREDDRGVPALRR